MGSGFAVFAWYCLINDFFWCRACADDMSVASICGFVFFQNATSKEKDLDGALAKVMKDRRVPAIKAAGNNRMVGGCWT